MRPCCPWTPRADPIHRSDPKIDAWVFIVIINDHEEMMSIRILVLDFCASLDSIVQFASADERRRQLARKPGSRHAVAAGAMHCFQDRQARLILNRHAVTFFDEVMAAK